MDIPEWAEAYIGLNFCEFGRADNLTEARHPRFPGLDCWGLVKLVLKERFGVCVPSYIGHYPHTNACQELGELIPKEAKSWAEVLLGREQIGDVIVLRMRKYPMHVGICLGSNKMLHIVEGIDACIEDYTRSNWLNRITGFYRHPEI